jgi:antitoxin component of RelBE/YafQ-DinJ toxin-antitoxin module
MSDGQASMTPAQALAILGQVVANTRALPAEVDAMREALATLADVVNHETAHVDGAG